MEHNGDRNSMVVIGLCLCSLSPYIYIKLPLLPFLSSSKAAILVAGFLSKETKFT